MDLAELIFVRCRKNQKDSGSEAGCLLLISYERNQGAQPHPKSEREKIRRLKRQISTEGLHLGNLANEEEDRL
jgi:hypothetical protein